MSAIRSLHGKVVLITGAASGIGLSCAQAFAKQGARVIITDLNEAALEAARQLVLAAGASSCLTVKFRAIMFPVAAGRSLKHVN